MECAQFIIGIPVTWNETKVLAAKTGEYVVIARRKNNKWYLGAITNSKARTLTVKADFLNDSKNYIITAFEDGVNADVQAMDYKRAESSVHSGDSITINMVRNGGYAAVIE
ncbi:MAG: glycoside hydrolase family 97 C-terminal domain-containing protein, partial [Parafilimonas sp.]